MMHELFQHPVMTGIAAYWIFSSVVGGMPEPTASSSAAYKWLFSSLHLLAGNLTKAINAKFGAKLGV